MFEDRVDAALKLCPKLIDDANDKNILVVGLFRGGLVVAAAIAQKLNLKYSPLIVKKLSFTKNPELAYGAMLTLSDVYINKKLINIEKISKTEVDLLILDSWKKIQDSSQKFKFPKPSYLGKKILLVDDGVATGASAMVCGQYLKKKGAKSIILVTPVIANDTFRALKSNFDKIIFLIKEKNFYAVGQFYKNFEQVSDKDIMSILK